MPNDDYIKRSDAISLIVNGNELIGRGWLIKELATLPAADVELVRHGRTIEDKYLLCEIYVCSVCKAFYPKEMEYFSKQRFKYCPNCGAKMSGPEGGENADK